MTTGNVQFLDPEAMRDGDLELVLAERQSAEASIWGVPAHIFHMRHHPSGQKMGHISFRFGERWNMTFTGQIGYFVEEPFRGQHYAERSCRLLLPFVRRHGLSELWITCGPENIASRRTLERLGAELVEIVDVPPQYPLLNGMIRKKCRYRLTIHQPDAHGRPQRSTGMNA
jgi:tagatose 1,6-diphosphate aldolase